MVYSYHGVGGFYDRRPIPKQRSPYEAALTLPLQTSPRQPPPADASNAAERPPVSSQNRTPSPPENPPRNHPTDHLPTHPKPPPCITLLHNRPPQLATPAPRPPKTPQMPHARPPARLDPKPESSPRPPLTPQSRHPQTYRPTKTPRPSAAANEHRSPVGVQTSTPPKQPQNRPFSSTSRNRPTSRPKRIHINTSDQRRRMSYIRCLTSASTSIHRRRCLQPTRLRA